MATEAPDDASRWDRRIELFSVMLIALTAVLAAWSAFQSSKWGGEMSIRFSEASALRTESVRESNLANRETIVDVGLFSDFAAAAADGDEELATFFQERFPDRLAVAVDAWLATDPLVAEDAPGSPFDMDEYVSAPSERAADLERQAEERAEAARDANQRGDNYTLTSIFLATVLLLAALSVKVDDTRMQRMLLGAAVVVFILTAVVISTFPVEV